MKTLVILPALIACLCAGVQAQTPLDTKAVTVTATVINTCKFGSAVINVALDSVDPSSTTPATKSSSVDFSCTNGYLVPATLINGTNINLSPADGIPMTLTHTNGNDKLPYSLKTTLSGTTGKGFGAGKTLSLGLSAEVQPSAFQNALGGAYSGSLTIELNP